MSEHTATSDTINSLREALHTGHGGLMHPIEIALQQGMVDHKERELDAYDWPNMSEFASHYYEGQSHAKPLKTPGYCAPYALEIFRAYCEMADFLKDLRTDYAEYKTELSDKIRQREDRLNELGGQTNLWAAVERGELSDGSAPEISQEAIAQESERMKNQAAALRITDMHGARFYDEFCHYATSFVSCEAYRWLREDENGPQLEHDVAMGVIAAAVVPVLNDPARHHLGAVDPQPIKHRGKDMSALMKEHSQTSFADLVRRSQAADAEIETTR